MNPALEIQPKPKGMGTDIIELVKQDLIERAEMGGKKYGEKPKPFNGRNALVDAYQEALDLCMYLRQKIEEDQEIIQIIDEAYNQVVKDRIKKRAVPKKNKTLEYTQTWEAYFNGKMIALTELKERIKK